MKDKNILIVGGTGSWGHELIRQLLKEEAGHIRVYARSESQMVALKQQITDKRVIPFLGDIKDKGRLMEACQGMQVIFHLAALKHVPICETMPTEAIMTNVMGTQNVVECAVACGAEALVYASTDKAVTPSCTYGCTKLLGEKLVLAAFQRDGAQHTRMIIFRSGNLLGSIGSVIPLFKRQIKEQGTVALTDLNMDRFFIAMPEAARLLIEASKMGQGGEIFLPKIPSIQIYDIAKYLLRKNGLDESSIQIAGLRPGERLHESMATEDEAKNLYPVSKDLWVIKENQEACTEVEVALKNSIPYRYRSEEAVVGYAEAAAFLSAASI